MKQIKSILLGISLFLLHSCNLLDVDTVSSITGDGYWNTKGDVESYLIGIYTKLRDTSNSTLHFEDRGDAFTTGLEGGPSNLWAQNLTSQNGYGWSSYYSVIQHCNMLLKYAQPGEGKYQDSGRAGTGLARPDAFCHRVVCDDIYTWNPQRSLQESFVPDQSGSAEDRGILSRNAETT